MILNVTNLDMPKSKGVSFSIFDGECVALYGSSQSGKSTLARLIVENKHQCITRTKPVIQCPQDISTALCPHISIQQHLDDVNSDRDLQADYLNALDLPLRILGQYPQALSIGQLKRIALIIAVLSPAKLIILDETLSSLDKNSYENTLRWIKSTLGQKSYLIISHKVLPDTLITHHIALTDHKQETNIHKRETAASGQIAFKASNLMIQRNHQCVSVPNLLIHYNQCAGIQGHSGSGKSSLLLAFAKQLPYLGSVAFKQSEAQWVFQEASRAFGPSQTIAHSLNRETINQNTLKDILKRFSLLDRLSCYPAELSGGCLQVFQLARALARSPKLLFLDEPTTAMDQAWREISIQCIKDYQTQSKAAILLLSHDEHELNQLADTVYVFDINNNQSTLCAAST